MTWELDVLGPAHERLEGVIDGGLQNRTDAEEAARREEAPYRMRPSTGPNLRRFWHPARYAFLSEAGEGRETTCNIAGPTLFAR